VKAASIVLALALAACGESPQPAAPKLTPQQRQVASVAEAFVQALGRHDWKSACATRSYDDHLALAKEAGTCERALQLAFQGKDVALLAGTVAGRVVIQGDAAAVDMVQRGAKRTRLRLFAIREAGRWLLQDPSAGR
jgi:hypothetical protein